MYYFTIDIGIKRQQFSNGKRLEDEHTAFYTWHEKNGFLKMEDEMELKHSYACSNWKVGI